VTHSTRVSLPRHARGGRLSQRDDALVRPRQRRRSPHFAGHFVDSVNGAVQFCVLARAQTASVAKDIY